MEKEVPRQYELFCQWVIVSYELKGCTRGGLSKITSSKVYFKSKKGRTICGEPVA
jgi:hypothetical protein